MKKILLYSVAAFTLIMGVIMPGSIFPYQPAPFTPGAGYAELAEGAVIGGYLAGKGAYAVGKAAGNALSKAGEAVFGEEKDPHRQCTVINDVQSEIGKDSKPLEVVVYDMASGPILKKSIIKDSATFTTPFGLGLSDDSLKTMVRDCPNGSVKVSELKLREQNKKSTCTVINDLKNVKDKNGKNITVTLRKALIKDKMLAQGEQAEISPLFLIDTSDGKRQGVKECPDGHVLVSKLFDYKETTSVKPAVLGGKNSVVSKEGQEIKKSEKNTFSSFFKGK